jgi:uncharacterized protein
VTGEPSHIELGVEDIARAQAFYGALLGWTPSASGPVDTATLPIGSHSGDPASQFKVFFSVADLDASIETLTRLGGRTIRAIRESPAFGRWAECVDDQGVHFGLRQSDPGSPGS